MIDNVLDQSKQVGKMTDKIISHINKQKDEMLEEEANMRLREHNVEVREEELCKKFALKAAKRKFFLTGVIASQAERMLGRHP